MTHEQLCKLLREQGFDFGWTLEGEMLTVWEHDADPPSPLTRPEANDVVAN
jgi:hypothetical protein